METEYVVLLLVLSTALIFAWQYLPFHLTPLASLHLHKISWSAFTGHLLAAIACQLPAGVVKIC